MKVRNKKKKIQNKIKNTRKSQEVKRKEKEK